ncbi:unnamed protein product [Penicillium salamii]|uniref:Uncharacterized protein n=1 Tax=Penicillium salamii TaxID=1612424 RepID=A0A9W4JUG4_9EURO|nr:unnamed protein product [Penicillium salamii]CAG8378928.1 unnamed protein product [Penicillium salamii]CAG8420090.1 unnamed protein product [Penicillium salamii]CAG8423495.1 unnamed protein product [Penicillium salamii]
MGFSARLSKVGPGISHPRFHLVAAHTHCRSLWRCARSSKDEHAEQFARANKRQNHPVSSHKETEWHHNWTSASRKIPGRSWEVWWSRSGVSDWVPGQRRRYWDAESQKRIQSLKKLIEADAYAAVFGRRLDRFHNFGKGDTFWNGYLQSFSKAQRPTKPSVPGSTQKQAGSNINHIGLQYDPISGRMAPMPPSASQDLDGVIREHQKNAESPSANEAESKYTAENNLTEDRQPQQGALKLSAQTQLDPHSAVTDSPEIESGAASSSSSLTQGVQARSETLCETEDKPKLDVNGHFGSDLHSFSTSESTKPAQRQPDHSKPEIKTAGPILLTDPASTATFECSPGNELEAKFIADPVSCSEKSLASELNTQQPEKSAMTVPCSPGGEIEANFTAINAHQEAQTDEPQPIANPQPPSYKQETVDCSPVSEIEAQIVSESVNRDNAQLEDQEPIYCPPGSELEANFITNPSSANDDHSRPPNIASPSTTKNINVNVDCPPGNELEAMFITDSTNTKDPNTDTGPDSFGQSKMKVHPCHSSLAYSEDRVGDCIVQNQASVLKDDTQPSVPQQSFPEFYIFAFDASTSQVTTATADTFFGINEDAKPSEILSQLHNPTIFLPYFEKMQSEGYEIAAGGGNILVCRKIHSTPSPENAEQDAAVHSETAKHLQRDSKDSSPSIPTSYEQTPEPLLAAEPSSLKPEPLTESGSSRGVIQRMIFAGVATAMTCYAIGAVTEFFRTGGKDGRGADAFTVFESDRRRE